MRKGTDAFCETQWRNLQQEADDLRGSLMQRPWLIATLLAMIVSPQLAWGELAPPYPIVDSGVWATNGYPGDMYWFDNERVLFLGSGTSTPIGQDDTWLLIWNTKTNTVTKYKQHVLDFCFYDGVIQYRTVAREPETGKRTWTFYRGKFNEELVDQTADRKEDKLNCRYISVWPTFTQGKTHRILHELDGYLVLDQAATNVKFENYPLLYLKAKDKQAIALPFHRYEADQVAYAPFARAYFLYPLSYFKDGTHIVSWPPNIPLITWWLSPQGNVEKGEIPLGPWTKGGLRIYPTKEGVFLVNRHSRSDRDPGEAGGYLIQGATVKKLISGVLTDISAVSPDGCRIAFSHAPSQNSDRFDAKNHRRLKMIDICETVAKP